MVSEYLNQRKSVKQIARKLKCSENKVTYWLHKHRIPKRSISEAIYLKSNSSGDPFVFKTPTSPEEWFLYGLGIGLYWGEGNKANQYAVRLGNTDPKLLKVFLEFLQNIFTIDQSRLRFGLQIFSDTSPEEAKQFWLSELNVSPRQFQKVIVTKARNPGTYRQKNMNGVLTVYFSNTKLRDSILSAIRALQNNSYANVAQSVERVHGKSQ